MELAACEEQAVLHSGVLQRRWEVAKCAMLMQRGTAGFVGSGCRTGWVFLTSQKQANRCQAEQQHVKAILHGGKSLCIVRGRADWSSYTCAN